jgi:hypothetical protein
MGVSLLERPMHLISERRATTAPSSGHACGRAAAEGWRTDADGRLVGADDRKRVVWLRQLLGRAVLGPARQHLGHVSDVVAHWAPGGVDAPVKGLFVDVGGEDVFVPVKALRGWPNPLVALTVVPRRRPSRRAGELLLAADVLDRPMCDTTARRVFPVADVALQHSAAGWTIWAVDTRSAAARLLGLPRRLVDFAALAARRVMA